MDLGSRKIHSSTSNHTVDYCTYPPPFHSAYLACNSALFKSHTVQYSLRPSFKKLSAFQTMKFSLQSICIALHVVCRLEYTASFAPMAFLPSSNAPTRTSSRTVGTRQDYPNVIRLQMANPKEEYVKADDGEALQALFASHCDKDGLMTKTTLETDISAIQELLVRTLSI